MTTKAYTFLLFLMFAAAHCAVASNQKESIQSAMLSLSRPDHQKQMVTAKGFQLSKANFRTGTRYVLVFYTASWCAHCKTLAPHLVKLYQELQKLRTDTEFLTVVLDDSVSGRASYLRKTKLPWPALHPKALEQKKWQALQADTLPALQLFELSAKEMVSLTQATAPKTVLKKVAVLPKS